MKPCLSNIVFIILTFSQLTSSAVLPETGELITPLNINDEAEISKVESKDIKIYKDHPTYDNPSSYRKFHNLYKPYKLHPSEYIGKKLVRKGQKPCSNGDYVLESSFPEPYRILKPRDIITFEYVEGRLNINVDENDIITSLTYG